MIEGTYGAGNEMGVGNFELCVAVGNQIEHWWRYNTSPGPWNRSAVFGADVRRVVGLFRVLMRRTWRSSRSALTVGTSITGATERDGTPE